MTIADEYRESIRIRCELILAHLDNASLHVRALQTCNLKVTRALADLKTDLEHPEWNREEGFSHE